MNHNEWINHAARLHAAERPFAVVTVLRVQAPTSSKAGDKAVVTADGQIHGWIGGGCAQPAVIKTVRRALLDGESRIIRVSPSDESAERDLGDVLEFGMACHSGGTLELFIDPVMPSAILTVVGASPVARALVNLAPRVGLRVAVVAHGALAADFPGATTVLASDDVAAASEQLAATPFVVVATQGLRDVQGLKVALALQPQGLWFVASAKKAQVLLSGLVASGEDPAAVARIVAPAGEFIGAQTPEEIALSVLASVVAARRGRAPQLPCLVPSEGVAEVVSTACSITAQESNKVEQVLSVQPLVDAPPLVVSCCGGKKKSGAHAVPNTEPSLVKVDSVQVSPADVAGPLPTKSSCCGG